MSNPSPKHTLKTSTYIWKGRDKNGDIKKNEITAVNEQLVRSYLQKQGITLLSVTEKPKPLYESKGRITQKHIANFSRQMATMLQAGLSVTYSLKLIASGIQKPVRLREIIDALSEDVETGSSFSEALVKHPIQFNELYVALVIAGEEAGKLDGAMDKIASHLEKSEAVKKKVRKAMFYPIIVILVALLVTIGLLWKIVPVFEGFFQDAGQDLPWLTQQVISVSHFVRHWGIFILPAVMIAIWLFFWYKKRHRTLQRRVNRWAFKLPFIGKILRLGATARFARTLSTLSEAGVPLLKGLNATAAATGSVIYEEATYRISQDVENGSQLNFAMQNAGQFEAFAIQMVSVGEETGDLDGMLGNIAHYYEEELNYKLDNLTQLLEPLVIVTIALIVGIVVIAMYLPIFGLGDTFG